MHNKAKKTTRVDILTSAAADKDGKLTFHGLHCADTRRKELGSLAYSQIFAGSRASIATALQVAGLQGTEEGMSRILVCNELCVSEHLHAAAKKLGKDFTLVKLLRTEEALVKKLGSAAKRRIYEVIEEDAENVLIIADPVAALATAYAWCENRSYQQTVTKVRLGQCEGFTLTLNENLAAAGIELELLGQKAA